MEYKTIEMQEMYLEGCMKPIGGRVYEMKPQPKPGSGMYEMKPVPNPK